MNWGIIGFGIIARDFVESLIESESETLYAIASRSNAQDIKSEFPKVVIYDSYEGLYNDPDVDIIYIATPHNFHFDSVIKTLESGKHVLCEKPMGISFAETQTMVNASKTHQKFLLEGMWTRYLPAYKKARELVNQGEIGKIRLIRSDFSVRSERDDTHRMWNPDLAGGSMLDLGVYNVALINDFFGANPIRMSVEGGIVETGIDEYIAAQLYYENGEIAQIYSGLNALTHWDATLYGEKGWIRIEEFFKTKQIITHINGKIKVLPVPHRSTGFYHEIQEAARCIKEGLIESPIFSHQDSLDSARIVEEILNRAKD